ncbi:MAG: hypothetical protein ACYTGZ_17395 [Planctomycetota bacterium]|jgi:hypothetical protein
MKRTIFGLLLACVCAAAPGDKNTDPREGRVVLPGQSGWDASLVIDNNGVGIWTVNSFQVFKQYACPEVVGLDNDGRCHVLVSYSGRWTPITAVHDTKWLGGLAFGDVDPRTEGSEIYVGSQRGNLYQIVAYPHTALDNRLIAHFRGREIHTIVAGDLDPRTKGRELFVFTRPGGLYRITPTGRDGKWVTTHLQDLPGRIRDARIVGDSIATVSRTGRLALLRVTTAGLKWETVYKSAMGMGRIAYTPERPNVLYTTHDDGRILRHERGAAGWKTATIYLGPEGPRGVAAGRFDADANVETVAVFGYSGKVQLLTRKEQGWQVETLFQDSDKGHWLAVAEVDGRNATRELISSGYSGRIVLLSRPAGYGRSEACDVGSPSPVSATLASSSR